MLGEIEERCNDNNLVKVGQGVETNPAMFTAGQLVYKDKHVCHYVFTISAATWYNFDMNESTPRLDWNLTSEGQTLAFLLRTYTKTTDISCIIKG